VLPVVDAVQPPESAHQAVPEPQVASLLRSNSKDSRTVHKLRQVGAPALTCGARAAGRISRGDASARAQMRTTSARG
jgi:hypothetical protein